MDSDDVLRMTGAVLVPHNLPRGARPSPPHKLLATPPFRPEATPPAQFAVVPKQLSYWLNNVTGICTSAEECYAKAVWSIQCGLPELFVPDAEVGRWAKKYGFYNGAYLTDVMDVMSRDGLTVNGVNYKDGGYKGVDYSDAAVLQAAIFTGPVKIAIDADALPDSAGRMLGWWTTNANRYATVDHCVGLSGYGTAQYLFAQLGVPLPTILPPDTAGYLLFTWKTVGFVTLAWLLGTCKEAYVRNPTTPGQAPVPPPPPPPPPSPPVPPAPGGVYVGPPADVIYPYYEAGTGKVLGNFRVTADSLSFRPKGTAAGFTDEGVVSAALQEHFFALHGVGSPPTITPAKLIQILAVIAADRAAGKTFAQIVLDVAAILMAP